MVLVDCCYGIYIPSRFVAKYGDTVQGISSDNLEFLKDSENMEKCEYWDTWDSVLNNAYFMVDEVKYFIDYAEHSGDLIAYVNYKCA